MSEDKPKISLSYPIATAKMKLKSMHVGGDFKDLSVIDSTSDPLEKELIERLKTEPNLIQKIMNMIVEELDSSQVKLDYSVDYAELPAILVLNYAVEVFENKDVAENWMKRQNRALGGAIPLDLLDTEEGVQKVYQLLTRIEYGVYS